MADLRTTQELEVDGYTVRIADKEDEDTFEAAVVEAPRPAAVTSLARAFSSGKSDRRTIDDAPVVEGGRRYVVAGLAVQEHLEDIDSEGRDR